MSDNKETKGKNKVSAFEAARQFREKAAAQERERQQRENEKAEKIKKEKQEVYEKKLRDEKIELIRMKQGEIEESELITEGETAAVKMTFGKRISNFFYHNKLWIILGGFVFALAAFLIYDIVSKEDPDVIVMFIDSNYEIGETEGLRNYLADVCGDLNGDGESVASVYHMPYTGNDYSDFNNGVLTKLMAEMQNADAMIVISGKVADEAFSPEVTLTDLETLYPDNPNVRGYGFYLKNTDFAEKIGYEGEIDEEMFIGIRKITKVQWASLEEVKEAYDEAFPAFEKIIEDLS